MHFCKVTIHFQAQFNLASKYTYAGKHCSLTLLVDTHRYRKLGGVVCKSIEIYIRKIAQAKLNYVFLEYQPQFI
jgi:hypothetical protein